jgi:hypothetical protein
MLVRLLHGAEHLSTQNWRGARYETRGPLRSWQHVMTLKPSAYLAVRPGRGQARSTLPDLHELMSGSDTEPTEERWLCWRLEMPPSRGR